MTKKSIILIIDDEKDIRESLSEILLDEGYDTLLNVVVDARLEEVALDEFFSACMQVN